MSIFDSFDFLSAYMVYLKILLQEVWRTTEAWTDEVIDKVFNKQIVCLQFYLMFKITHTYIFYASEQAYAAEPYFPVLSDEKFYISSMCQSKSRFKTISLNCKYGVNGSFQEMQQATISKYKVVSFGPIMCYLSHCWNS